MRMAIPKEMTPELRCLLGHAKEVKEEQRKPQDYQTHSKGWKQGGP